jgi:putative photosynthetic complex assembly protein
VSEIPEHGREPVPGLPEELPPGETILWQGAPDWKRFAVRALHVRKLAIYFGALLLLRLTQGPDLLSQAGFFLLAAVGIGLMVLLAWLMARSSLYTITNRRIVMRFGIAIPMSINLPFNVVESVDLRLHDGKAGDIAIQPAMNHKLSYIVTWPHVRPWKFSPLQPMMRCLDDADDAARILVDAISLRSGEAGSARRALPQQAPEPDAGKAAVQGGRQRPFPLPPLLGAAALVGVAVASVAWWQLSAAPGMSERPLESVQSVQLRFEDRADGSVAVFDADNGDLIDELAPGTNNFLRATLRGLVRGRNAIGDLSHRPFTLQQLADGRLLLTDPVTYRHIDLWAFGETNALAFQRFLQSGDHADPNDGVAIDDISASIEMNQTQERLQ